MTAHVVIVTPHIRPDGRKHANAFDARVDGVLICTSETPFFDAARALLKDGTADPSDMLVMRHAGAHHDALRGKVGAAAGLRIEETGFGPRRRRYAPRPTVEGPPRIEPEPLGVPEPPSDGIIAVRGSLP